MDGSGEEGDDEPFFYDDRLGHRWRRSPGGLVLLFDLKRTEESEDPPDTYVVCAQCRAVFSIYGAGPLGECGGPAGD